MQTGSTICPEFPAWQVKFSNEFSLEEKTKNSTCQVQALTFSSANLGKYKWLRFKRQFYYVNVPERRQ